MGTRADFYIGRDPTSMQWCGSIAWDGYPKGIDSAVLEATTVEEFSAAMREHILGRDDFTPVKQGWPWPWKDSQTTDYAYCFDVADGKVYASCFGRGWFDPLQDPDPAEVSHGDDRPEKSVIFPDMTTIQNVSFGKNSGLIILQAGASKEGT